MIRLHEVCALIDHLAPDPKLPTDEHALGERWPVWDDGAPDLDRHIVRKTTGSD